MLKAYNYFHECETHDYEYKDFFQKGKKMKIEFCYEEDSEFKMIISGTEFLKADDNKVEFNSLAFATDCFFSKYGGRNFYIDGEDYTTIKEHVKKGSFVIITVESGSGNRLFPTVYVRNEGRDTRIDIYDTYFLRPRR